MKPLQTLITALLIAAMAVGVLASGAEAAQQAPSTPISASGASVADVAISGVAALDSLLKADTVYGPAIGSVAGLTAMLAEGASAVRKNIQIRQEAPFVAALHKALSAR